LIVVGLTGGIASGKSTVSKIFDRAGAVVIDADLFSRQVVEPGKPAWEEIRAQFGRQVFKPDGTLDRERLGDIVFQQKHLRRKLEAIIHPRVRAHMDESLRKLAISKPESVVVLDVPLLLETGMDKGLAEVIVVYAPADVQRRRLMLRNGFNADQAQARIDAQMPMDQKRSRATLVIDNGGHLAETEKQAMAIYRALVQRARSTKSREL
jgi:dephospho-CoA kinase